MGLGRRGCPALPEVPHLPQPRRGSYALSKPAENKRGENPRATPIELSFLCRGLGRGSCHQSVLWGQTEHLGQIAPSRQQQPNKQNSFQGFQTLSCTQERTAASVSTSKRRTLQANPDTSKKWVKGPVRRTFPAGTGVHTSVFLGQWVVGPLLSSAALEVCSHC